MVTRKGMDPRVREDDGKCTVIPAQAGIHPLFFTSDKTI
jgi:hypothetical protein